MFSLSSLARALPLPGRYMRIVQRSGNRRFLVIASIGNPEPEYEGSRHNAGHRAMNQLLLIYWKDSLVKNNDAFSLQSHPETVIYKSNNAYMNMQGKPIQRILQTRPRSEPMVILHDELQLPVGKFQIRAPGTSPRGHNGLKSLNSHVPDNYTKIAIGIGRPSDMNKVTDHVLSKFDKAEAEILDYEVIPKVVKVLEKIIGEQNKGNSLNGKV